MPNKKTKRDLTKIIPARRERGWKSITVRLEVFKRITEKARERNWSRGQLLDEWSKTK